MKQKFRKIFNYWPELVLGLGIVSALVFRLGRGGIISDDATYSFRAIRLVDFMASGGQTTPWQWFATLPWWIDLSFHDAPPLFFWLQHAFFVIFGVSTVSASIVPVIGGCISALFVYLLVRLYFDRSRALIALGILVSLNPFIWLHRLALLESIMVPCILITWYAYLRAEQDKRWYWLVGIAGGLALMTKYTAIFLALAILIHLSWKRVEDWKSEYWWRAVVVVFITISPIILYNYFLWLTRGHFDVQFAAAFGQSNADWPILGTQVNLNIFNSLGRFMFNAGSLYSWPLLILCLWSLFRLVHYRHHGLALSSRVWFSIIAGMSWLFVLLLTRTDDRFIATGYIFFVLLISAIWPIGSWRALTIPAKIIFVICLLTLIYSLTYTINTNHVSKPWGVVGSNYSESRREDYGLAQVEAILNQAFDNHKPSVLLGDSFTQNFDPAKRNIKLFDPETVPLADTSNDSAPVIIYDRNMNWFASLWYFYSWSFYGAQAVLSTQEAATLLRDPSGEFSNAVKGVPYIIFITTDNSLLDSAKYRSQPSQQIVDLQKQSRMNYIFGVYGQPVWEVYSGQF